MALLCFAYFLYPGTGGYAQITAQKWTAYLVLTGGFLALSLLLRLELSMTGTLSRPKPLVWLRNATLVQRIVLIYLGLCTVSTVLSPYPEQALLGSHRCEGLIAIVLYGAVFLVVSTQGPPGKWVLPLCSAALILNCLLAFAQFAGFNPLRLYPDGMTYYDANIKYSGEFLGTIGNVDILSAVFCLAIPALASAIFLLRSNKRLFLLIPLTLCLTVLVKMHVAGGYLGVLGAVLFSVPVLLKDPKKRRVCAGIVILLVIAALIFVYLFGGSFGGTLQEASELLHGNADDSFGSGRIYIWRNVLPLVAQRPLFGGGPDTLGLRTDAAFERVDEETGFLIHSSIDVAHNEYLNILINQGAFALIAYLVFLVLSAARWIRNAPHNEVVAISGCAVLGYSIQAFFGISSPVSAPFFWLALAWLNSVGEPEIKRGDL